MIIIVLYCTINNELCNLSAFFFTMVHSLQSCDIVTNNNSIVIYLTSMSVDLVVKILFLIVVLCGMIVAYINLCINEAMRRQGAYRLVWEQKIERDQIQRGDNISKVSVV